MAIKSPAKYTGFVIFNWLLISGSIYLFTPGKNQPFEPVLLSMYFAALVIIIAQYPALVSAASWKAKILIFYISMVIFLAIVGLTFTWNESVGANTAGTWAARFDGAFRFVFFGHIFGAWSFPFVVFVNWLLRNWFFESPTLPNSLNT
jgi:Ca2+/Na+ antiporter